MPLTVSSSLSFRTMSTMSVTSASSGTWMCLNWMPTSSAAFAFMRTYTAESGRVPAWIIASCGLKRGYWDCKDLILPATSSRMDLRDRVSGLCAGMYAQKERVHTLQ